MVSSSCGLASASSPRPAKDFLVDVAETNGPDQGAPAATPCSHTYQWKGDPYQPFGRPVGDIGLFNYTDPATHAVYSYLIDADQVGDKCTYDPKNPDPCYQLLTDGSGNPDLSTPCSSSSVSCVTGPGLRIFLITHDGANADILLADTVRDLNGSFEAPAMFQAGIGGPIFLLASHKTAWVPNENEYNYNMSGPPESVGGSNWLGWQGWTDVNPADKNASTDTETCDSQTFFVLPVTGTNPGATTSYIYMGDRWDSTNIGAKSLGDSGYVWLPLQVSAPPPSSGNKPSLTLNCLDNWSISTATGAATTKADPAFTFTNVGSTQLMDGPPDNSGLIPATGPLIQAPSDGLPDQQWEIISEGSIPDLSFNGSSTPVYEIGNVGGGGIIEIPCTAFSSASGTLRCIHFSNPLEQAFATIVADPYQELWEFVSDEF